MSEDKYENTEDSREVSERREGASENRALPDAETVSGERGEDGRIRSIKNLHGMFENWFLDYASYVILERAVPNIRDGLKPVQRRILHAMKQLDDGRYNKCANIIGHTMQYHPHGDASIGDALVQLGQKDLLVDCQGNWGNIYTGDAAAAPRYIEARLSKFAQDVVFNPKVTDWKLSYDGRNKEPVCLPVKFPLLLAQGVEGIAVGLASKILPHNFVELIDASVAYLRGEEFVLYPDFPTGGMIDVSRYNDGLRGGSVKIRAKIDKEVDSKILKITELPFGKTTTTLIESIIKANEKGKIKIKKIDDNTAADVEIRISLGAGVSLDKTIDALYAFTDCELSVAPNACIIDGDKPYFIPVSDILKRSTDTTVRLLKKELEIRLEELSAKWFFSTLEKIFIEKRIYKDKAFEESETLDAVVIHVRGRLEPFLPELHRSVEDEDIRNLLEIKMKRILKFNSDEADAYIKSIEEDMAQVRYDLEHLIPYAIAYYLRIKETYGKGRERKTEIRSFENIEATKVAVANEKLYIDREEGFVGTSLKKDEFICECSDIDDIIVFRKDGTYYITKIAEKLFVGNDVLYVNVFKKNDKRCIYNVIYRDGKYGTTYVKRFNVTGITRDKEYDLTKGTKASRILHFSANPNGEAEIVKICLKPKSGVRKLIFEYDFADLAIKGRHSIGNILTKNDVHKISVVQKGISTLGGRKLWIDEDVFRLNPDGRGRFLGEFYGGDKILVVTKDGKFHTTDFDLSNHYEGDYIVLEKYVPSKIWSAVFYDGEQEYYYLKRFKFEESQRPLSFIGDFSDSRLIELSGCKGVGFTVYFAGKDKNRPEFFVDAEEFIAEKSYRARGKRLTTFEVGEIVKTEPENPKDSGETSEMGGDITRGDESREEGVEGQMSLEFEQ